MHLKPQIYKTPSSTAVKENLIGNLQWLAFPIPKPNTFAIRKDRVDKIAPDRRSRPNCVREFITRL